MIDYLAVIADESSRFAAAIAAVGPTAQVPSCPEWTVADLQWHLTEVQYFWASIAEGPLMEPELVRDLDRPADPELAALFRTQTTRLQRALAEHDPSTPCWSWHEPDQTIGFLRRRQAHEALIHRVDAELARGAVSEIDPTVATDGIDEFIAVMVDGVPEWGRFEPDGTTATIIEEDGGTSWTVEFGRFLGTSPNTGTAYDLDTFSAVEAPTRLRGLTLRGPAAAIDLWIWGRGGTRELTIEGELGLVDRIRRIAAESSV